MGSAWSWSSRRVGAILMGPPSSTLATHLIQVTPEVVAQDASYGQVPGYPTPSGVYLGIIEQSEFVEIQPDEAIRSSESFQVFIFSGPNLNIATQTMVQWVEWPGGPVPADVSGIAWDVTAIVDSTAKNRGPGCWYCTAEART
jgi:hypothetical protein